MGLLQNSNAIPTAAAADFYEQQINFSVRMDGGAETIRALNSSATNRDLYTFSTWLKRSTIDVGQYFFGGETDNYNYDLIGFASDNTLRFTWQRGSDSGEVWSLAKYRDTSAWMHVVAQFDTTQASEDNRIKLYINGVQITQDEERYDGWIPQNEDLELNANGNDCSVGSSDSYDGWFKGYMAQTAGIDGSVVAIGDLGESKNGVWIPKDLSGLTFGNNGFLLEYATNTAFGDDTSGNGNDFTDAGLATSDQMKDSPTFDSSSNGGNFATLNPLGAGSYNALSEGNLRNTGSSGGPNGAPATMGAGSGKWYWEVRIATLNESHPTVGISAGSVSNATSPTTGDIANLLKYTGDAAGLVEMSMTNDVWGTYGETETGLEAFSAGDICMLALDIDNKKLWYGKNGTWFNSGDPAAGSNPQQTWTGTGFDIFPVVGSYSTNTVAEANFGSDDTFAGTDTGTAGPYADSTGYGSFYYAPPTDFLALCAGNLSIAAEIDPAKTDDDYPQKLFSPLIWTGDGTTGRAITGLGFQSDFIWFKDRDQEFSNRLYDTTRGISGTGGKRLFSNTNGAETDQTSGQDISAVGSDGFTLGASDANYTNYNTSKEVAWSWRANGGTTSAGSGDLTSTHQVDPSGRFSIVSYTANGTNNQTFSHGLSAKPDMVIVKSRSQTANWAVYTASQGATKYLKLNDSTILTDSQYYWNDTEPTSSVVTLGDNTDVNYDSGQTYIAYCFANTEGYIKAGEYTGNGDADGTFVYTGFRPAFVLVKATTQTESWQIFDSARDPYNVVEKSLQPDNAYTEGSGSTRYVDFLSNGFKWRATWEGTNRDDYPYIYAAFAKNPFKYATAR